MKPLMRHLSAGQFIAVITLLNMVLYHLPLYRYAYANLNISTLNGVTTFLTLLVVVFVFTVLLLSIVTMITPPLLKPVCILAAVLNACALYFMVTYRVILDRTMMANIFNTRMEESSDFLSPGLLMYIVFLGVIPALIISKARVASVRRLRLLAQTISLVVLGLIFIYINSSTWLWFDKHGKMLGGSIVPWSYVFNTVRHKAQENHKQKEFELLPPATVSEDKTLVVLVIGETARSANFSLYGYARETNPQLQKTDIAVLRGATSCSTYTTASLHCMLSHTGKTTGSDEPLPSYLQRHGIDVLWRSNNWGEDPLDIATYETATELRGTCVGELCQYDDALLTGLEERLNQSKSDNLFVTLHTKGSHGPAYHTRYPASFDIFEPVCRSVELDNCSQQSLVNAYDNTIAYTDSFLYRTIQILERQVQRPVVLIYVSDHGESLGEFGVYLHGVPYTIAPDVQKDIPFLVWMSDSFKMREQIDTDDLQQAERHSHRQVFHSILGAFGVNSEIYNRKMDIFHHSQPSAE